MDPETRHLLPRKDSVSVRVIKAIGLNLAMVLIVGAQFGYPALHPVLQRAGLWSDACSEDPSATCEKKREALIEGSASAVVR
jgi:hypothetical protein